MHPLLPRDSSKTTVEGMEGTFYLMGGANLRINDMYVNLEQN